MATLDVSDVLLCPEFTDKYVIQRNAETVDDKGRSTVAPIKINSFGVVTMASGKDLQRLVDYEVLDRVIKITTKTQLQSETNGSQPDIIIWRGDNYVVKDIKLYPQFGQGFYSVLAASIDLTDKVI